MERKRITNYCSNENYCILIPVYYECENTPSCRKVFTGTKNECKKVFKNYPEYLKATNDENRANRKNKMQEYLFYYLLTRKNKLNRLKYNTIFNSFRHPFRRSAGFNALRRISILRKILI